MDFITKALAVYVILAFVVFLGLVWMEWYARRRARRDAELEIRYNVANPYEMAAAASAADGDLKRVRRAYIEQRAQFIMAPHRYRIFAVAARIVPVAAIVFALFYFVTRLAPSMFG